MGAAPVATVDNGRVASLSELLYQAVRAFHGNICILDRVPDIDGYIVGEILPGAGNNKVFQILHQAAEIFVISLPEAVRMKIGMNVGTIPLCHLGRILPAGRNVVKIPKNFPDEQLCRI